MVRPVPSSSRVSRRLARQRHRNTAPEMALRRVLHAAGLRYFIHRRPLLSLRREADLVFASARVAVFVDGCFWHGCLDHRSVPSSNRAWWRQKIADVRQRDIDTEDRLTDAGWKVIRVWEHEDVNLAADRVRAAVVAAWAPGVRAR
jgi:DNA mismatch endonuclease, patch repair protein